jgi:hypothetical protein
MTEITVYIGNWFFVLSFERNCPHLVIDVEEKKGILE